MDRSVWGSPPVLLGLLFFVGVALPLGRCEGLAEWYTFPVRAPDHGLGSSVADEDPSTSLTEHGEGGGRRATVCKGHSACDADHFCHSGNKQTCEPCAQCRYQSDSVDGRCPQTRCPGTPAGLLPDTSAPTISWVFLSPVEVDVGSQKKWVDVFFHVADEGSGFERAEVLLTSASLSGKSYGIRTYATIQQDLQPGGRDTWGVIRAQFWFEDYDEGGLWAVREIYVQDGEANTRVYDDNDFLKFGAQANVTVKVHTGRDKYVACASAGNIACESRDAECVDVRGTSDPTYATCQCEEGFLGNAFACIEEDALVAFRESGQLPTGTVLTGDEAEIMSDPREDNTAHDDPSSATPSPSSPAASGSNAGGLSDVPVLDMADGRVAGIAVMFTLLSLICLQGVRRYHMLVKLVLQQRRHARSRVHDESDAPDAPARMTRSRSARGLTVHPEEDDEELRQRPIRSLMWLHNSALMRQQAEQEMRDLEQTQPRGGGRGGNGSQGTGVRSVAQQRAATRRARDLFDQIEALEVLARMQQRIDPLPPPNAPPPVLLPEHLRRPQLPGEVKREIPEGLECCVCMEQERCTRLEPCKHTDMCHGCAQHLFSSGAACPICRSAIRAVVKTGVPRL